MGRTCDKCGARMAPFLPRTRLKDGSQVCKGCAQRSDTPDPKNATSKTAAPIPDHYRVLVLDRGEEVPIVVWSGHNPSECMSKAMLELGDPETVHVYIERLRGAMGQYQIIWKDGEQTEHFAQRKVAHDSGDGETIYHCPFCGAGQVIARSDGTAECGFCKSAFTVQVQPTMPAVPQTINGVPYENPEMPGTSPGTAPVEQDPNAVGTETELAPEEQQGQGGGGIFASKRYFLTDSGVALPGDAYLRHLAIKHADDRQAVIAAVRAERQDRG